MSPRWLCTRSTQILPFFPKWLLCPCYCTCFKVSKANSVCGLLYACHGLGTCFSSAQCQQSLLQQCRRGAGLQLHHNCALPFREQLQFIGKGRPGMGPAPWPLSTVKSQMHINPIALASNNTRKQQCVLYAGLKGADSGTGFPGNKARRCKDGRWAGRARLSNSSLKDSQGRGTHNL